jgi:hypothetical protein
MGRRQIFTLIGGGLQKKQRVQGHLGGGFEKMTFETD